MFRYGGEALFPKKEVLPVKIYVENAVNHEMRKNCYNELCNSNKNHETFSEIVEKKSNPELDTLSVEEFRDLMIEASTFNKSSKEESALLQKLRLDNPITDIEPSDKTTLLKTTLNFLFTEIQDTPLELVLHLILVHI
ncbi:uncharacterized protein CEXT_325551 [Caerostris extrusa]|uniref:Uncharacterized protein n=1 Tax=Caerostris extrusa TaxID=172846 RepID=A0AAV4NU19_CAEEX|nr:uncharacterized protein CEXT_325551 [Caerostris extrusa]